MNKITTAEVRLAQMAVSNLNDETRVFDITATVAYNNDTAKSYGINTTGQITSGTVLEDGKAIATFMQTSNLSVSYLVTDAEKQQSVLSAVQDFCGEAVAFARSVNFTATVTE